MRRPNGTDLRQRLVTTRSRLDTRAIAGLALVLVIGLVAVAYVLLHRGGGDSLAVDPGITSFYLEAKVVVLNNPATGNDREVASQDVIRWWYANANLWRWEVDASDASSSSSSSTDDQTTTGDPATNGLASYVGVADGHHVWIYDVADQTYQTFKPSQYPTTELPIDTLLGPIDLNDLFDQWRQAGIEVLSQATNQVIVQREADLYEYGPTWQTTAPSGPQSGGVGKIWVDQDTGLILRNVVDDGPSKQYTDTSVTLLDIAPNLDASLFEFTPPDGSTKLAPTPVVP